MNRRRNKSNQVQPKRGKIIRCSKLTRPVFDNDTCHEFNKSINKESDNNCRNCKYSF